MVKAETVQFFTHTLDALLQLFVGEGGFNPSRWIFLLFESFLVFSAELHVDLGRIDLRQILLCTFHDRSGSSSSDEVLRDDAWGKGKMLAQEVYNAIVILQNDASRDATVQTRCPYTSF